MQIVTFNLEGMTEAEFLEACDEQFAPAFASVPGLVSKVWLKDSGNNTYGGVYTWRDRQAMEDYAKSDLFNAVANHPNFSGISSTGFDVLEGPTKVTNGLVEAVG